MNSGMPSGFPLAIGCALVYIVTLLHLSAFRRDANRPGAWFGPVAELSRFLSRDTYTDEGQGWLTLVRVLLFVSLAALVRMVVLMKGQV